MRQWRKGIASWQVGRTLYLSIPFTWLLPEAARLARAHLARSGSPRVCAGGPAVKLIPRFFESMDLSVETPDWPAVRPPFDVLSMHNPLATFTSRGCIRRCKFCAVPVIEGEFRELPSVRTGTWKPAPVVCDNNILACSARHMERVCDSLVRFAEVDFNQGLDARLFVSPKKASHIDQIRRLKSVHVRFALDHINQIGTVADAVALARRRGFPVYRMSVYVLIGFDDTPDEARAKLESVRAMGVRPFPMRYQPISGDLALAKNDYVAATWTDRELKTFVRYYANLDKLDGISFDEFAYDGRPEQSVLLPERGHDCVGNQAGH